MTKSDLAALAVIGSEEQSILAEFESWWQNEAVPFLKEPEKDKARTDWVECSQRGQA
jgi:hypothetical protein